MNACIFPITPDDVESFRECLDTVARERRYLALLEAPSIDDVRRFVAGNIAHGVPQVVARDDTRVVGWCDMLPGWHHTLRHCGSLGMGLLPAYRGLGIGTALFEACLDRAVQGGITRVELETREDNTRALNLYRRLGFRQEGIKVRGMRFDDEYFNTVAMSLLIDR